MSILSSHEINEGRTASDTIEFKGEAVRSWRVETSTNSHGPVYVLDNAHTASPDPIALEGDEHPESSLLFVKSRDCRSDGDDGKAWIVTAKYDNQFKDDPASFEPNPLNRPVKYSLEWSQFSRIVTKDAEGALILNTVDDRFDEPLEQDDSRPILVAVRNHAASELGSLIALAVDYKDAVNSDTFYGAPPGSVKMAPFTTGEIQYENGVKFYTVRYEFHFRESDDPEIEGWERQILNRGNRACASPNVLMSRYTVKDGPKNLNEDGTIQGPSDEPFYISVKTYRRRPFAALNL